MEFLAERMYNSNKTNSANKLQCAGQGGIYKGGVAVSTESSMHGNRSILIVDDEIGVRMLLYEVLKDVCPEVCLASDGKEALGLIKSKNFAVIFIDMCIPGMNGCKLMQELKDMGCSAVVVSMSAYESHGKNAENLGDYRLKKPFDVFEVKKLVRNILTDRGKLH